jgi:hypothetical protein
MIDTAWTIYKLSVPCREQIFFFSFGTSPFPTPPMVLLITALRRIGRGIYSKLFEGAFFVGLMLWDLSLTTINLLTFKRKIGHVTPKGMPGEGGVWPQYIPPRDGDSRCSCPALNAMANHGPYFVIASTLCSPLLFEIRRASLTAHARLRSFRKPRFPSLLQDSSLATDATSPSASYPCQFARRTTLLPRSVSTCRATSPRSSTDPTMPGASTFPTSTCITASNMMHPSYVSNNKTKHPLNRHPFFFFPFNFTLSPNKPNLGRGIFDFVAGAKINDVMWHNRSRHLPPIPSGHAGRRVGGGAIEISHGTTAQAPADGHPRCPGCAAPTEPLPIFQRRGAPGQSDGRL